MKKLLALLLAVSMAFSLCACGSDSGVSTASDNLPAPPDNSDTIDVDVSAPADGPDDSDSQLDPENPTNTEIPDTPNEPIKPEPTVAPSGLILMTTTDINFCDPKIYCVDIETGESRLVAEWDFRPRQGDVIYYSPGAGFSCGHREWFTSGYDRIAISRTDTQSGQTCAGWLDADGNFFNVSEALGQLNRGDFDDPAQYYAVGFTDDEFFVYRQIAGTGASTKSSYHYVPLSNLDPSAVQDGLPYPGCEDGEFPKEKISDYIGGSRFLINASEGFNGTGVSRILDMATGEEIDYVPGTSRMSWHAVLSPDGAQVAFMSQPKNGTEKDIYIMPLAGGDPVKVLTDGFSLSDRHTCETGHGYGDHCTMLVEWR